jgi:aryl-alcohol dehydrogenase-like predicted oxidoreductase
MQYRQLGNSDLKVPVVSFGAWVTGGWFWGGADDNDSIRAIQRAIDEGITCIDTAPAYGMGHSEEVVGKAIAGRRDEVVVATKCCLRWDSEDGEYFFDTSDEKGNTATVYRNLKPDSIKYECEQSLKRLGVDVIDLYQCHWPDPTTPIADTMGALVELQKAGKIRYYGVSNFTPEMMDECLKHGSIMSDQPPYSPLKRDIEADVMPYCVEKGLGMLVYSPIAQGLMTGKVTMDREFPESDVRSSHPWFQPRNRKRVLDMLEQIKPIADGHGATLGQVTIAWVVAQNGITTALVGGRTEQQVVENAQAGDLKLSDEEVATIRGLVEGLGEPE